MNEHYPPTLTLSNEEKNLSTLPKPLKTLVYSGRLELMADCSKLPSNVFHKMYDLNNWQHGVLEIKTPAFN